jgi:hypothetical protein
MYSNLFGVPRGPRVQKGGQNCCQVIPEDGAGHLRSRCKQMVLTHLFTSRAPFHISPNDAGHLIYLYFVLHRQDKRLSLRSARRAQKYTDCLACITINLVVLRRAERAMD